MEMERTMLLDVMEIDPKFHEISHCFESSFHKFPLLLTRVPGRINLFGDHLNYCGYFVLSMAIEQDIIIAVRPNETTSINLVNCDSETYKKASFSYEDLNVETLVNFDSETYKNVSISVEDVSVDTSAPRWYHFFICGYLSVAKKYTLTNKGLDVVVKGTIPQSSDLSSSSAVVYASALATSYANGIELTSFELSSLCALSEQYIGTHGGGMDQIIGLLDEPAPFHCTESIETLLTVQTIAPDRRTFRTAKLIEFNPLKATNVHLPETVIFVVCNSGVAMDAEATSKYNIRMMECKLAAKVLAKVHGFNWQSIEKLSEIPALLDKDISEMKSVVEESFPEQALSREELCSLLEISDVELSLILSLCTQHLENFQLRNRAIHVFEEAFRVKEFQRYCEDPAVDVVQLGNIMNQSYESSIKYFDYSHPIGEELVTMARHGAGALGSKLTGAGGKCCVSMIFKNKVEAFMSYMKENFYLKKMDEAANEINLNSLMFATEPSCGAIYFLGISSTCPLYICI